MAEFVVYPQGQAGARCEIIRQSYTEEQIDGFVLVELVKDRALCEKIYTGLLLQRLADVEVEVAGIQQDLQLFPRLTHLGFAHRVTAGVPQKGRRGNTYEESKFIPKEFSAAGAGAGYSSDRRAPRHGGGDGFRQFSRTSSFFPALRTSASLTASSLMSLLLSRLAQA